MAREETARGGELDPGELAVGGGLESGDGVGVNLGAVGRVNVGHLGEGDVAVGGDQELVVGRDGDLSGRAVLSDGGVGVGAVGRLLVDLLEGEAAGAHVGDLVGDDLGDELVDHEEVRLGSGLPEGGVTGTIAGGGLEVSVLDELAGRAIDAEDVCGIQTEVGEDHVLAGWVENRVVDVRSVGLLGLGAHRLTLVANVLEELESAILDAEGRETVTTVVSNGKVLVIIVQLSRDGATAGNVDERCVNKASVLVECESVETRVVGCVPGLVHSDGFALQTEVDPRGLRPRFRVFGCLLESSVGEIKRVNVTVGVAAGRTVATNKELDGRGGSRHTGEEESSQRHREYQLVVDSSVVVCRKNAAMRGKTKNVERSHNIYKFPGCLGLVKEQWTVEP